MRKLPVTCAYHCQLTRAQGSNALAVAEELRLMLVRSSHSHFNPPPRVNCAAQVHRDASLVALKAEAEDQSAVIQVTSHCQHVPLSSSLGPTALACRKWPPHPPARQLLPRRCSGVLPKTVTPNLKQVSYVWPKAAGRLAALQNAMDELRRAGEAALRSNVDLRRENDSLALKNCELAAAGSCHVTPEISIGFS